MRGTLRRVLLLLLLLRRRRRRADEERKELRMRAKHVYNNNTDIQYNKSQQGMQQPQNKVVSGSPSSFFPCPSIANRAAPTGRLH